MNAVFINRVEVIGMILAFVGAGAVGAAEQGQVPGNSKKTFTCLPGGEIPVIDGTLTEACWAKAQPVQFNMTTVSVTHDENFLFIGFACEEPEISRLRAEYGGHDEGVWSDDSVEVFLAPHGDIEPYYQFVINSSGTVYDGKGGSASWNPAGCKIATGISQKQWTVEMAIPFAGLEPESGFSNSWRVNFCRNRQAGNTQSVNWADISGLLHQPKLFGIMELPRLNRVKFQSVSLEGVALAEAKPQFGENQAQLTVSSHRDEKIPLVIETTVVGPSGKSNTSTQKLSFLPGETKNVAVTYELAEIGRSDVFFTLTQDDDRDPLVISPYFRFELPPILSSIKMVEPSYHLTVYKGSGGEPFTLKGDLRIPSEMGGGHSLQIRLLHKDREVLTRNMVAGKDIYFSVPPGDLADGWHDAELVLLDRKGRELERKCFGFNVAADKADKVWIRKDKTIMLDGKPFFPFGWWDVPANDDDFQTIKEAGFNMVLSSQFSDWLGHNPKVAATNNNTVARNYLDLADKYGLKALMMFDRSKVAAGDIQYIEERVLALKDHRALFAWYTYDEPEVLGVPVSKLTAAYETIVKMDPYHPVFIIVCRPQSFKDYLVATDILSYDDYPITSSSSQATGIAQATRKTICAADEFGKAVIMTLQGCDCGTVYKEYQGQDIKEPRAPTVPEEKSMTYQTAVQGARGILYYAYKCWEFRVSRTPGLWEGMVDISREMDPYRDFILAPAEDVKIRSNVSEKEVITTLRKLGSHYTLFVVNIAESNISPLELNISFPAGVPYQLVQPTVGAKLLLEGNVVSITDSLDHLGVNVYQFELNSNPL